MHTLDLEAFGWCLILAGFLGGAAIGLGFQRADFLGGYASLRRRLVRLAHIACVALGLISLEFARSKFAHSNGAASEIAALCFVIGGVCMPLVCLAVAWRERLRLLFALPIAALTSAAILTILGVLP